MMVNDSNGPVNNQSRARTQFFTPTEVMGWCFAFGLVDILIVMSNTLAIVVFTRSKLLRKRTNYFLLCLAIADMMVGTISLPIFVHTLVLYTRGEVLEAKWIDVLHRLLDIFSGIASIFALTTIALERLYSVVLPNWHRTTPSCLYFILISMIWIVAGVHVFVKVLAEKKVVSDDIFLYLLLVSFFFCVVVICLAYIGIWFKVNQRIHEKTKKSLEKDKKLATTLFLVSAIFILTWFPFQGMNIFIPRWCEKSCTLPILTLLFLTKLMQYMNSFINPIIYTFKMPDFRRGLLTLFGKKVLYGASTRATSRMLSDRRRRASTLRSSETEANGNCECAL
ncbi:adenosine receptor A3-like [Stylophora pistillata]|uniref:adenosine receptor A3-like n=1 Tax=Stylophora pistillata TaxID=50429 RepID=UPI000C04D843|nr:adenosine receptor A3-like [Stylophora pistillata]XP_022789189.1 adenosine receptor A3-like [Stylophora pistillata]XP_022789190.1 adenosine receptor A3-like [Stylophora pistillata]XP_022789191.1 adenosine receptor A3-like [Stylophora pistillata]XP_022789192.1 adenosine receptor A3-like [Stylophora pistillata]XP_022789193.1 adenosine receptor A3-like [Stylophora pistillata]XP_022789194.1 adenosine receptor A3-like [Stylophora pistillata]XP_022789195.1 adenosine receptor A3-like [Stylophora